MLWTKLKALLKRKRFKGSKDWIVKPGHEIRLAFECDGIEYYCFTSGHNSYVERFVAANDYLDAMEYGIDPKFMKTYIELSRAYKNKGDLVNDSILLNNLEERTKWTLNMNLVWYLAAVWFFDKGENCYEFNETYAEEKIAKWKRNPGVLAFFLKSPIMQFLKPINLSVPDMLSYSRGQDVATLITLKSHLAKLSKGSKRTEEISMLQSQITELEELVSMIYE